MINHVWMTRLDDELSRDLAPRHLLSPDEDVPLGTEDVGATKMIVKRDSDVTSRTEDEDAADVPDAEAPSTDV